MEEIVLKNELVELVALVASSSERNSKSEVSFDVIDKSKKLLFGIYTDNEDLLNGHFSFIIENISEKCDEKKLESAVKLFNNFLFASFPIRKICFTTNQKDIKTIKSLMNIGYKVEACLKQDMYVDGEYVDKIMLAIFR